MKTYDLSKAKKTIMKQLARNRGNVLRIVAAAGIVGILGVLGQLISHATSNTTSLQTENGTISNNASLVDNDTSASGGKAVKFGYEPAAPGTYKPSAETTGYTPYGTHLIPYTNQFGAISGGVLTITASNVTISGYDIPARVVIKGNNVTIAKSKIHGDATPQTADDGLVECATTTVTGCVIEDSVLAPDYPSVYLNGIRGHDFTAARNEIYNVVDGIDVYAQVPANDLHVSILANYIHDLSGFGPDALSRPFTHNDCIQWVGGTGLVVKGNTMLGFLNPDIGQAQTSSADPHTAVINGQTVSGYNPVYPAYNTNSVLQVNQSGPYGVSRGLVFDSNWVDGGGITLNLDAGSTLPAGNIGSFTNNHFGRANYYQGGNSSMNGHPGAGGDSGVTFYATGFTLTTPSVPTGNSVPDPDGNNTYEDNGHPITIRTR